MFNKIIFLIIATMFLFNMSFADSRIEAENKELLTEYTQKVGDELAKSKNFNMDMSSVTKIDGDGVIEIRKFGSVDADDMYYAYGMCNYFGSSADISMYMGLGGKFIAYWYIVNENGILKKQVLTQDICINLRQNGLNTQTAFGYRQSFVEYLNTDNNLDQYFA